MFIQLMMLSNNLILCHLFCFQFFSASGTFPISQFFTSGGQSTGASATASVLSMNIHGWFLLGLTGWISLQSKGLSRVFSSTTVLGHQFFGAQHCYENSFRHRFSILLKIVRLNGKPLVNPLRNFQEVFQGGCTVLHWDQEYTDFWFSTLLSKVLICLFAWSYLTVYEVASRCGFDLQFPATNDVAHLFLSLLAICISSLEKWLFKSFAYF